MPTMSNPASFKSAAVTDESTPPDIATTMRWAAGSPGRSMSRSGRIEPHPPEIGFQPRRAGERCGQCRKAALTAAPGELLVERRGSVAREALVVGAGIHIEPVAVGVTVALCPGVGEAL